MGGGVYAGGYAIQGDMLSRLPKMYGLDDLYLRVGAAYVDTYNLPPTKDWRRFAPFYVDGMWYFMDNVYVGAGLNFPFKVSDDESGNLGGQAYLGGDLPFWLGKLYAEAGYSVLRREVGASFKDIHVMAGYRYDYATIFVPDKVKEVKPEPKPVIREEIEIEEEIEIITPVPPAPKPAPKPTPKRLPPNIIIYKIKEGDTLSHIAERYYGYWRMYPAIAELNDIEDPALIYTGDTLKIDLNLKK
jgi:LysM repeat protein